MRLDQYVAQKWPEYSRSVWKKYIDLGHVTVNDEVETSSKRMISDEDIVSVSVPDKTDFSSETLPLIYEDDNVIVINKPVGVLSHSKGELNDEFTVADFFRMKTSYHGDTSRPGIIHRLDRATSGVMIGARNEKTATLLIKQFQDRRAKKTYYAVVDGVPKENKAVISLPIGRNPSKPSTFRVDPNGKQAETYYEVEATNGKVSLVKLQPKTGRTHQLRVHMAYIGNPIRGDVVYGSADDRLFLHAASLEITIPTSHRTTFVAPLPREFKERVI